MSWIIELPDDNFDYCFVECEAEAEAIAWERYGSEFLGVHEEKD